MTPGDPAGEESSTAEALAVRIDLAQFSPTRERGRYDMHKVDDLLDQLKDAVLNGKPVRPLLAAAPKKAAREGYVRSEVEAFLLEVLRAAGSRASSRSLVLER